MIPKFRAWDGEKMLYRIPIEAVTLAGELDFAGTSLKIMQSTGINDLYGTEIFVGDIIKIDDFFVEVKSPELFECDAFIVYGYHFCSGFFIDDEDETDEGLKLNRFYSDNPVVVGNIYENKELLIKK